ncbi:MAG: hypothetical protein HWN65_07835 [Candidatus Helarchaeota archaeon]|nr:hypothetical protein [Candidatus Helarchaeota archaeon]
MKPKKKILLLFTLTLLVLCLPLGLVFSFDSDFDDFIGSDHTGGGGSCHDYMNPESPTGYVSLSSSAGERVLPGEVFYIALQVISFSEAANEDVSVGFPSGGQGRGDNKKFSFNVTEQHGIALNSSGTSTILWFNVTAPLEKGVYILIADAVEGNGGVGNMDWATGSITIIVWLEGPDPDDDLLILYILVAIGLIAAVVALIFIKRRD